MKRSQIKKRPLSDTVIANLEPEDKPYSVKDSQGLYLHIKPSGAKSWLLRYKDKNGTWRWHGLGAYPYINGATARKLVQEKFSLLANGMDRLSRNIKQKETFADVVDIWINEPNFKKLAERSQKRYLDTLNNHLLPKMGKKVMVDIDRNSWLSFFRSMQKQTHHISGRVVVSEAIRAWQLCCRIYTFAMNENIAGVKSNPVVGLNQRLEQPVRKEMAHVSEDILPNLLRDINSIQSINYRIGLLLLAHLFLRPNEILDGKWEEIDFDNAVWEIPAERMKKRRPHIVPLSHQVIALLKQLRIVTGDDVFLFPSKAKNRQNTRIGFYMTLRRKGYEGEQTLHGFRHIASTKLNNYTSNDGFKFDERVIECALAHKVQGVRGVYNKADYLNDRRILGQWYSDWLESIA